MALLEPKDVPVFVLCGGFGTRLKEETEFRPKPMVPIGERPIVWHIMRTYASHGFRRFVMCLGYKAEVIKDYFLNYSVMNSDFTVELASDNVTVHSVDHEDDWEVTLAYTGEKTMTGGRVARAAARYLGNAETFAVTYGDGVTDADLGAELAFHADHGRIGTVLGVNPPSRFGELKIEGDTVEKFEEKPEFAESWINGGYFFFRREFLPFLSSDDSCILERAPLGDLARAGELSVFRHPGFWHCMDTQRDRDTLDTMWRDGTAAWKV
jgi:glucose-1-phosphate cytidylyltransferase